MVFVKVRETYDLHTIKNKMSVIAIHTPNPSIIKSNFPGLLMQCKAYRPYSCDVRVACASVLPVDPLGVGTEEGEVAPEDMFNPILYSAMSNFGMSQLEARINAIANTSTALGQDIVGPSAVVDTDSLTSASTEFDVYYGLLANAHGWKHANPQSGLSMTGLKPLVYERLYNIGDNGGGISADPPGYPLDDGTKATLTLSSVRGNSKPLPFINCTSYSRSETSPSIPAGFDSDVYNNSTDVPWIKCVVGAIVVPPSRLHELFYRCVIEWTIEFSQIRPLGEIASWGGLTSIGQLTHYKNYDYESTKATVTGSADSVLDKDSCMMSANVELNKVM